MHFERKSLETKKIVLYNKRSIATFSDGYLHIIVVGPIYRAEI